MKGPLPRVILRELRKFNLGLSNGSIKPYQAGCGLCYQNRQFSRRVAHNGLAQLTIVNEALDILHAAFKTWPEYSGDRSYPIGDNSVGAEKKYGLTQNMWEGEYGDARRRLAKHVADYIYTTYLKKEKKCPECV